MQKKLIALAVAGLVSGGAFAQSNVTIYGIVDVGMESSNSGFGSKLRVTSGQSAGNRIGFRGEEALGGGTTAFFNLESGFVLDNGQTSSNGSLSQSSLAPPSPMAAAPVLGATNTAGTNVLPTSGGSYMFQRLSIAGLKGSWGTVQVGRQYTPAFAVRCASDNTACGTGAGLSSISGTWTGYADRFDNAIAYISPNFSGFTASLALSSGLENNTAATAANDAATATNRKAGRAAGFNLQYANGPVYVGYAYHDAYTTVAGGATDVTKVKGWLLGGTYDFKAAKLHLNYGAGRGDSAGLANNRIADNKVWAVGVTVPMGAHSFRATYGRKDDKLVADQDWKQVGLSYEYAMSKRTALYAAWSKVTNDDRTTALGAPAGAGNVVNSALNTGLMTIDGNYDPSALQFGMRHSF